MEDAPTRLVGFPKLTWQAESDACENLEHRLSWRIGDFDAAEVAGSYALLRGSEVGNEGRIDFQVRSVLRQVGMTSGVCVGDGPAEGVGSDEAVIAGTGLILSTSLEISGPAHMQHGSALREQIDARNLGGAGRSPHR